MSIKLECRICFSKKIEKVLNLGMHPLANSLNRTKAKDEKKSDLCVFFCKSGNTHCASFNDCQRLSTVVNDCKWLPGT